MEEKRIMALALILLEAVLLLGWIMPQECGAPGELPSFSLREEAEERTD